MSGDLCVDQTVPHGSSAKVVQSSCSSFVVFRAAVGLFLILFCELKEREKRINSQLTFIRFFFSSVAFLIILQTFNIYFWETLVGTKLIAERKEKKSTNRAAAPRKTATAAMILFVHARTECQRSCDGNASWRGNDWIKFPRLPPTELLLAWVWSCSDWSGMSRSVFHMSGVKSEMTPVER